MKKLLLVGVLLLIAVLVGMGSGTDYYRMFKEWNGATAQELKAKGDKYLREERMDSALVLYTMAGNKYRSDLSDDDKKVCAGAYNNAGYVYFFYRHDYSSSYTNLLKAQGDSRGCR